MRKVDLGIDMGGTGIKLALVGKEEGILKSETVAANSQLELGQRLKALIPEINSLLGEDYSLNGIGVAFPGIVDFQAKRILSKHVKYPRAQEADPEAWALENWGVPLVIENDARAALIGEWQYGAGMGARDLVMFTLGTGVGSAVLLEGKLLRGRTSIAGNLGGHMNIDYKGDPCNCGSTGCVETVGSTWAIPNHIKEFGGLQDCDENSESFRNIFSAATAGDPVAIQIRDKSLEGWSAGILNFILAYDPEKVILGGGIMQSKDQILPFIQDKIAAHPWLTGEISIVSAEQTKHAGILGMCYLLNNNNI